MKSLILVTFGFLGVAFYALSGGSEFDPVALRLSRIDAAPLAPAQPTAETNAPAIQVPVAQAAVATDETVSRNEIAMSSLTLASLQTEPATSPQATREAATSVPSPRADVVLPSLIPLAGPEIGAPRAALSAEEQAGTLRDTEISEPIASLVVQPSTDLRAVTGSRVNVRAGPSTGFDIVTRLSKGNAVEVLRDPGNGWVEIRPTAGGSIGWMADYLLSDRQQ